MQFQRCNEKLKASIFYYLIRPVMNRLSSEDIVDCPVCGKLLQKYDAQGYLHISDGDADCYSAIGVGKGSFK